MPSYYGLASTEYFFNYWELCDTIEDAANYGTAPGRSSEARGLGSHLLALVQAKSHFREQITDSPTEVFEEICQILEVCEGDVSKFEDIVDRPSLTCQSV